jgi:hypothetical protein
MQSPPAIGPLAGHLVALFVHQPLNLFRGKQNPMISSRTAERMIFRASLTYLHSDTHPFIMAQLVSIHHETDRPSCRDDTVNTVTLKWQRSLQDHGLCICDSWERLSSKGRGKCSCSLRTCDRYIQSELMLRLETFPGTI